MENTKYQSKPKSRKLRESVVPQSGPLLTPRDLWDSFYASMRQAYPSGLPSDRKHGQNWPVIRNDYDLRQARAFSRLLADTNPLVIGFLDHITNFVVGSGFKWAVGLKGQQGDSPQEKRDPSVIRVRGVLDDWRALNGWGAQHEITFGDFDGADDSPPTDMEAEAWRSAMRDGEFFLRLFPGGAGTNGIPSVRRVNPECVYVPPGENPEGPWSFGIQTDPDDRQRRLNYHVADPDLYPTDGEIVPAREIVHFKLNVDSDVKRGVPDFWPLEHEAQHLRKSWQNIAEVVAVLSAIAYIRQHAPGVSTTQISNMLDRIKSGTDHNSAKWADTLQGSDIYRQFTRHEGGTVVDITNGMQYESAPAVSGMPGFVQGMQAALRIFGLRWGCPEYFSGDSSNANFASTLVAGGPFERAAQRRQQAFARFQGTVIHRVLLFATQSGRLTKEDVARVAVKVQPPAVAIANKAEDTQRRSALYQAGVLSKRTWCAEEGLDPDLELTLRKQEDAEAQAQQQQPGGGGDQPPEQPQPAGPNPPAPDADPAARLFGEAAGWDESAHPRDDSGQFVSGDAITAAKSDPAKAKALRDRVTDPEQRAKLDAELGGKGADTDTPPEADLKAIRKHPEYEAAFDAELSALGGRYLAQGKTMGAEHKAQLREIDKGVRASERAQKKAERDIESRFEDEDSDLDADREDETAAAEKRHDKERREQQRTHAQRSKQLDQQRTSETRQLDQRQEKGKKALLAAQSAELEAEDDPVKLAELEALHERQYAELEARHNDEYDSLQSDHDRRADQLQAELDQETEALDAAHEGELTELEGKHDRLRAEWEATRDDRYFAALDDVRGRGEAERSELEARRTQLDRAHQKAMEDLKGEWGQAREELRQSFPAAFAARLSGKPAE